MSNLFIDGYSGAYYDYNKAKNTEKFTNDTLTTAGVAATGAAAYGVSNFITRDPMKARRIYQATDKYVKQGYNKAADYGKKALDYVNKNETVKKATGKISKWLKKGFDVIADTNFGKNVAKRFNKFTKLSGAKRGKYMLIAAGVALAGGIIVSLIRNHDRNDGAIDQKYRDINTLSAIL